MTNKEQTIAQIEKLQDQIDEHQLELVKLVSLLNPDFYENDYLWALGSARDLLEEALSDLEDDE